MRTKEFRIQIGAQGTIQWTKKKSHKVSFELAKCLRMDKKPNRFFCISHVPEMNAKITEKLLTIFKCSQTCPLPIS